MVKRARPDLEPGFVFLSSRVRVSTQQNWSKLVKEMPFVSGTKDEVLTLSTDDSQHLYWHIDAAVGVHSVMRSHAGGILVIGFGATSSRPPKEKMRSRSLTEEELIAVDEKVSKVTWCSRITQAQGFKVSLIIVFQHNLSMIKLEENVKLSLGKRTSHFVALLFHVTNLIIRKEIAIDHFPNGMMLTNYFSKLLTGKLFRVIVGDLISISFRE